MIETLAVAITFLLLGCAVAVIVQACRRRYRRAAFLPTLLVLQVALTVQAVADLVGLMRGHRTPELAVHVAYLVVSLVLVPLALFETRSADGPWSGALLTIVLFVLAAVVVRMQTTWRPIDG